MSRASAKSAGLRANQAPVIDGCCEPRKVDHVRARKAALIDACKQFLRWQSSAQRRRVVERIHLFRGKRLGSEGENKARGPGVALDRHQPVFDQHGLEHGRAADFAVDLVTELSAERILRCLLQADPPGRPPSRITGFAGLNWLLRGGCPRPTLPGRFAFVDFVAPALAAVASAPSGSPGVALLILVGRRVRINGAPQVSLGRVIERQGADARS